MEVCEGKTNQEPLHSLTMNNGVKCLAIYWNEKPMLGVVWQGVKGVGSHEFSFGNIKYYY